MTLTKPRPVDGPAAVADTEPATKRRSRDRQPFTPDPIEATVYWWWTKDGRTAWSVLAEREIAKGDPLWPRLEPKPEETICMDQPETTKETPPPDGPTPDAPGASESGVEQISIDQFAQVEMRVGRVVAAEAVPKSRKLLKVQLDTGSGERQVVAGIAGSYEPETLVGRTVVFVANLKPVKLAGVESNGMMLAASDPEGKPVLVTVDDPAAAPPGSKIS